MYQIMLSAPKHIQSQKSFFLQILYLIAGWLGFIVNKFCFRSIQDAFGGSYA